MDWRRESAETFRRTLDPLAASVVKPIRRLLRQLECFGMIVHGEIKVFGHVCVEFAKIVRYLLL